MTLVLAIIGVVLSVISLGWQAWSWRRGGPVVTVHTNHAYPVTPGGGVQTIGVHMVAVNAVNRGRSAVQVTGWGFRTPDDQLLLTPQPLPGSDEIPMVLDAHSSARWFMPAAEIERNCREMEISQDDLRGVVILGNGTTAKARRTGIGRKPS